MSIQIGVYDFFSYTIPGGFYLAIFYYVSVAFNTNIISFQKLINLPLPTIIIFAILAYVVGVILDPIGKFWHKLFGSQTIHIEVFKINKQRFPNLDWKFGPNYWFIPHMLLVRENPQSSQETQKLSATQIMLRNVSFSIFLLTVIEIIQFFRLSFVWWHLANATILGFVAYLAGREGIKFRIRYFNTIYQEIACQFTKLSDLVTESEINSEKIHL